MITLTIISISFFTYSILINLPPTIIVLSKFVPKLPIRRKFISLLDGVIDTVNPNSAFYTETGLLAELEAFKSRDAVNDAGSSYSSSASAVGFNANSDMLRVFQLNMLADGLFGLRADLGNLSSIIITIHTFIVIKIIIIVIIKYLHNNNNNNHSYTIGAFSRAKRENAIWENRKLQLLHELLQYNPDVITLQECDHYYDFFLPQLSIKGTNMLLLL
jgi:hypothetical protein